MPRIHMLTTSLACAFPLFSRQSGKSRRQSNIIFLCQHFGTGVLIATAFVHLLPTAFTSLTDPCLPYIFSEGYRPLAGLIAMVFALAVVGLESYLTTRGAGHSHSHDLWEEDEDEDVSRPSFHSHGGGLASRRSSHRPRDIAMEDVAASEALMAGVSPLPGSTPRINPVSAELHGHNGHIGAGEDDDDRESLDLELNLNELGDAPMDDSPDMPLTRRPEPAKPSGPSKPSASTLPTPDTDEQRRLFLQCVLLEAGILFHSVFIGMALSVATGPSFVVFLVAIAFHQCFEGLALGSRIAALHFPRASLKPWFMVLAFGATTPFGQFIGLVIHNLYDPLSQTGLLMVGFMNAISSGLLLFAGLVQLLAEDFLTEKSYQTLHGSRRLKAFAAVVSGSCLMALVGAIA